MMADFHNSKEIISFLNPSIQKVARYYVIPSENFECLSRPSVSALFPDSNFKLCIDIDIGEEWFGIANGLNLFINNKSYGPWLM